MKKKKKGRCRMSKTDAIVILVGLMAAFILGYTIGAAVERDQNRRIIDKMQIDAYHLGHGEFKVNTNSMKMDFQWAPRK